MCKKQSLLIDGLCDVRETIGGGALTRGEEGEPDGWRGVSIDIYLFGSQRQPSVDSWTRYLPTKPKSHMVRPAVTGPIRICLALLFFESTSNQG